MAGCKVRETDNDYYIEREYACINGLSAWFTIAIVPKPDAAEIGYTDGGIDDAKSRADQICAALSKPME